jgi:hypothetical protein
MFFIELGDWNITQSPSFFGCPGYISLGQCLACRIKPTWSHAVSHDLRRDTRLAWLIPTHKCFTGMRETLNHVNIDTRDQHATGVGFIGKMQVLSRTPAAGFRDAVLVWDALATVRVRICVLLDSPPS